MSCSQSVVILLFLIFFPLGHLSTTHGDIVVQLSSWETLGTIIAWSLLAHGLWQGCPLGCTAGYQTGVRVGQRNFPSPIITFLRLEIAVKKCASIILLGKIFNLFIPFVFWSDIKPRDWGQSLVGVPLKKQWQRLWQQISFDFGERDLPMQPLQSLLPSPA